MTFPAGGQRQGPSLSAPVRVETEKTSGKRKGAALAAIMCACVLLMGCANVSGETVRPAMTGREPVFEGWGTSLCWWANRIGYSDSLSQKAADLFFSPDGLGMNIMRYNIGGGDDPNHAHITRTDSDVPGWYRWDEAEGKRVFDPTADFRQLNVLARCHAAAGREAMVEAFSNSPPYYMTVSGCSSGNAVAGRDNLREDAAEDFADYLCSAAAWLKNEMGLNLVSLSPMNEPGTAYWGAMSPKQEGCHFDPGASQSRVIVFCGKKLKEYGLDGVIVAASDETDTGKQLDEYLAFTPEARAVIGRINTHTYGTSRASLLAETCRKDGMVLWMSETDGGETCGKGAGEMGAALWLSRKIISDFALLDPSAWVLWQVIDTHVSRDGWQGRRDSGMPDVTGGYWGTATADHDRGEIILTQKYYALGQFTRYIRPGMRVFACGENMLCAAGDGKIVLVAVNAGGGKALRADLSAFGPVSGQVAAVRTSGSMENGEHWRELEPLEADGTGFDAYLAPDSVTTFVIEGPF